ncbi:MAG: hypothetical protein WCI46_15765 [Verrucomicrobiota bacterium]
MRGRPSTQLGCGLRRRELGLDARLQGLPGAGGSYCRGVSGSYCRGASGSYGRGASGLSGLGGLGGAIGLSGLGGLGGLSVPPGVHRVPLDDEREAAKRGAMYSMDQPARLVRRRPRTQLGRGVRRLQQSIDGRLQGLPTGVTPITHLSSRAA